MRVERGGVFSEFRDLIGAQYFPGRLFDGSVAVQEQIVVAPDDDAQVPRQVHRVSQPPMRMDEFIAQAEMIGKVSVELARQRAPLIECLWPSWRRTQHPRFALG